ncbi:Uncharacterised protein C3orf38 (DUF4518) [Cinara cedri]|uniref:Uncharacterized protein n=1 Tax=Cinara cedri TaxID=506608 RepID=A0A5E4M3W1_9HEMI|nr:Uncharacterised protein C3orf38 (DUF4518) [Cinara cedri]
MNDDKGKCLLFKQFLEGLDTIRLCEIARSVYAGQQPAYTRDAAEQLLFAAPYMLVLSNKKLPALEILKFLVLNGIQVHPNMSKMELCSNLMALFAKESGSEKLQKTNLAQTNIDSKNMLCPHSNSITECHSSVDLLPQQIQKQSEPIKLPKYEINNEQELLQKFIYAFSEEFYVLFNNLGTSETKQLKGEHFFNYCMFHIKIIDVDAEKNEFFNDSMAILQRLLNIKLHYQLYLSPYVNGVKWEKDIHGLIKICLGGRLYQYEECIGTFEQLFSLGEDLQQGNIYRILNSSLILKSMNRLLGNGFLKIE